MLDEGQLDVKKVPNHHLRVIARAERREWLGPYRGVHSSRRDQGGEAAGEDRGKGRRAHDGALRFKTSDYGIKPYSTALGAIKNRDEVELVLHVVGTPLNP